MKYIVLLVKKKMDKVTEACMESISKIGIACIKKGNEEGAIEAMRVMMELVEQVKFKKEEEKRS